MSPSEIVSRCTIDGHTRWAHVAAQLGRPLDSVRAELDPTYLRTSPRPVVTPTLEQPWPDDPTDFSSPYVKPPPMRTMVLARLRMGQASAETIAAFLAKPHGSVQNVLTQLRKDGMVESIDGAANINTGARVMTWRVIRQRDASVAGEAA